MGEVGESKVAKEKGKSDVCCVLAVASQKSAKWTFYLLSVLAFLVPQVYHCRSLGSQWEKGMSIQWAVGLVIVGSEDRCVCKTYSKDSLDLTVLISNVRTACTMVHSISTVLEYSCTRPYTYTS